jgi:phosphoglucomutase
MSGEGGSRKTAGTLPVTLGRVLSMHPRAGEPATPDDLVDVQRLLDAYVDVKPDPDDPAQQVAFGTSGHRGTSLAGSFNEAHIAAISQAICDYRTEREITGPLLIGRDTHALSEPAWQTVVEVLVANDVAAFVDERGGYTPTPAVSHGILRLNRQGVKGGCDGIVVTPSHNPPSDGGIKYNPPHGGPADTDVTGWIAARANALLAGGLHEVRRRPFEQAYGQVGQYDFLGNYVGELPTVVDLEAIRSAGLRIGADPMGGASIEYWATIAQTYGLDLHLVNPEVDPQWAFMTLDHDGKIRMDCSSAYAMSSLVDQRDAYDIATGNDADADRHGIVTPDAGLMNPNHFLAVAIDYLVRRRNWPVSVAIGKTLVSSSMIDRVASSVGRRLMEVPVGFKWFVQGLLDGGIGIGGEESAGASFLRRDGRCWTTDKDGIILALVASEIRATTGRSPSDLYGDLVAQHGEPAYARVDEPADREQKARLARLRPEAVRATELAGDPIIGRLTAAPGNGAPIGGLKVVTENAWFAARPSGTEDIYKIYAESFKGPDHLAQVQAEARDVVATALG